MCNTNIFGNNQRFKSYHPTFKTDSLDGIITLKKAIDSYAITPEILNCQVYDANDTILRSIVITFPVNIAEEPSMFKLYPNPCKNNLHIKTTSPDLLQNITVYNCNGQKVVIIKSNDNTSINTSTLEPGIYLLKKATTNNCFYKKSLLPNDYWIRFICM